MIFHPLARQKLRDAAIHYEGQQAGLGEKFVAAVGAGLKQIEQSPVLWRRIRGDVRRYLVKVFPYGIVYAPRPGEIFILAVMHLKREPDYWLGRLDFLAATNP